MPSIKTKKFLGVVAFALAFLVTRIPFLGYDAINPDAVNWHFRSEQFIVGLKLRDFSKTYQHYHPGVTLMWTMGIPIEVYRQINPQSRVYNEGNFLEQHSIAKYSLTLVQLTLSILLIKVLIDILGFKKSLLAVSVFTFEPFFLGNSRLLHMDVLLALFITLALAFAYKAYLQQSLVTALISGIFAGLSFLTKSVGALAVPIILIFFLAIGLRSRQGKKRLLYQLGIFLLALVATTFILFPALWVKPGFVISDIYNEGLRVGARRGHEQVVMGDTTDVAGPGFYPLVLALKTSPLVWLGLGLFIFQVVTNYRKLQRVDKRFVLFLCFFFLVYFLGMTAASKKIDRYMVPLFPLLGIVSSLGILEAYNNLRGRYTNGILTYLVILVTGIGVIFPLIRYYPYYFTYTNPLFGSAENANKIVGQKPFGLGIPELKYRLINKYGNNINLGFIDRKPMSMIYPNSKLFDIREAGTRKYDLIVLGPNEEIPENVADSQVEFVKDGAMYINGLEFWRIYSKTL